MKGAFAIMLVIALILNGCDDSDPHRDTLEYFQLYLTPEMTFDHLKSTFGNPDSDVGSGIHIYVYNLRDGRKIQIGFTDRILYAIQRDKEDKLLMALI